MKKILLIHILLFLLVPAVKSQILIALVFGDKLNNEKLEFGMNVGLNSSTISNANARQNHNGLNIGLNFVYKFSENWCVNPALYFSYPMGARDLPIYETSDTNLNKVLHKGTMERELSYFSLPVTLRYRLFGLTYFDFGPQFCLNTNAEDIFTVDIDDEGNVIHTQNVRKDHKLFDAGLTAGFTQKIRKENGVSLKLRYYYGLLDISKKEELQYNSSIYFSVGIPIGGNSKGKEDKL